MSKRLKKISLHSSVNFVDEDYDKKYSSMNHNPMILTLNENEELTSGHT